jgi:hypothetical protein
MQKSICFLLSLLIITSISLADTNYKVVNIFLVIDGSYKMNETWADSTRIAVFQKIMPEVLDELQKEPSWGFNVGVRFYGDQNPLNKGDCVDLRLGAPIEWFDPGAIKASVEGLKPLGKNCFSNGISMCQDEFPPLTPDTYNCIVAVVSASDGCKLNEVDMVKFLKDEKKVIRGIHIIGLNLDPKDEAKLKPAAEKGEGYFVNVESAANLKAELLKTLKFYALGKPLPAAPEQKKTESKNSSPKNAETPKPTKK